MAAQTVTYYIINVPNPEFNGTRRKCEFVHGEFRLQVPRRKDFDSSDSYQAAKDHTESLVQYFIQDGYAVGRQKSQVYDREAFVRETAADTSWSNDDSDDSDNS